MTTVPHSTYPFVTPERCANGTGATSGTPPTFSVIIAAYQAAAFVGEAVESALRQVPAPHEVIVSDDGSTDDLPGALAHFGDRVRLIRGPHRGEAAAKNAAVRASHGDYVAILDADDLFLPDRLRAFDALARCRPDLDVLTTDALLEADGRVVRHCYDDTFPFETSDQRTAILRRNFVFGLVAARRSRLLSVGGFDEDIAYTTDWDCWVRMVFSGSRIGLVDVPLAVYRLSPTAMSARRADMARGRIATLTKAQRRSDLSADERATVERALADEHRRLLHEELKDALRRNDSGPRSRRLAMSVAQSSDEPAGTRARAIATALAPGTAARVTARSVRFRTRGAADTLVARDTPNTRDM